MAKINFSRMSFFFYFIWGGGGVNLSDTFGIRTERCLRGLVDRSTGSLTAVGSKLGCCTCGIA